MVLWTSQEVSAALGQELPFSWEASGISIDTRTLQPGDLYIAIRGNTHDGHTFVKDAFEKGAVAVIVDHAAADWGKGPQIVVEDTLKALFLLGTFARNRSKATFIAVTGSVGKTSTKELLRHVLGVFGQTFASPASYNNHWGVPLSLASMPRETIYGVFEIGMNHRGEIAPLAQMVRPHIGVITTIVEAHIGHMGTRQAIVEEKLDVFSSSPVPSLGIIHQDIPEFDLIYKRATQWGVSKILGFGKSNEADIQLLSYRLDATGQRGRVTAKVGGRKITYTFPQPGEHLAVNSLVALALGEALGLDQSRLIRQLETVPSVQGRLHCHRISLGAGEILLIDDAYNANLTSMQAGLSVLATMSPLQSGGQRIVVLGEMLELGDQAEPQHHQLMAEVLARPIDRIFAVGGEVVEAAFAQNVPPEKAGGYAVNIEILFPLVMETLRPGDIIFVKGSKGSRVSKIVDALLTSKA